MLKTVKALIFFTALFLSSSSLLAQLQLKLPTVSATIIDVKKVLQEYPNRFANITGTLIRENAQSTDYECTLKIDGAEEVFITHFPSKKNIRTWEATLLTTEAFEKVKQKYKSTCNQLNNLSIKIDGYNYKLNGVIAPISEDMKFTSTVFSFSTTDDAMKKLRLEVSAQFLAPMEWKIKLLIYEKEREDNEKGSSKD
jgi:hypothetical protein